MIKRSAKYGLLTMLLVSSLTSKIANASTTVTGTVGVSATVIASCTIATTPVAFGNYTGALLNANGNIALTCTTGTAVASIGLDGGVNAGANAVTGRYMVLGTNHLPYSLYSDSGRTTNWGNPTGGPTAAAGTGAVQNYVIYGQIAAGQTVPVSAIQYVDTVNVTVIFN